MHCCRSRLHSSCCTADPTFAPLHVQGYEIVPGPGLRPRWLPMQAEADAYASIHARPDFHFPYQEFARACAWLHACMQVHIHPCMHARHHTPGCEGVSMRWPLKCRSGGGRMAPCSSPASGFTESSTPSSSYASFTRLPGQFVAEYTHASVSSHARRRATSRCRRFTDLCATAVRHACTHAAPTGALVLDLPLLCCQLVEA